MLRTKKWCLALLLSASVLATGPAAGAAGEPSAQVRALASQGVELFKAGKYDEAIERFEQANKAFPAPQYLVYIARALVKKDKLLEAKEVYGRAATMTVAEDAPESFSSAQATAAAELSALLKTIPVVEIVVGGPAVEKVRVTVDGKPVPATAIVPGSSSLRLELDPGEHRAEAAADGFKTTGASFTAATRTGDTTLRVFLSLSPEAAPETSSHAGTPPKASASAGTSAAPKTAPSSDIGPALRISGGVLMGLGVAGIAGGAIAGGIAWDRRDFVVSVCPDPQNCTSKGVASAEEGRTAATISTVAFVTGGVVAATGLVLWIAAPRPAAEKKAAALVIDARGLTLEGRF